jgi:hypothetical protein
MKAIRLFTLTAIAVTLGLVALSQPVRANDCEEEANAGYFSCLDDGGDGSGVPCYLHANPEGCSQACANGACDYLNDCMESEEDVCGREDG